MTAIISSQKPQSVHPSETGFILLLDFLTVKRIPTHLLSYFTLRMSPCPVTELSLDRGMVGGQGNEAFSNVKLVSKGCTHLGFFG